MSGYTQVQRQLQILTILNDYPQGLDIATLHNSLKTLGYSVTERTIRRDIHSLSHSFSIYEDNCTKPARFILQKTSLRNLNMSFEELQAIRLIQELIRPYNHLDIGLNAEKLLENLLNSLPSNQRNWLNEASPLLKVSINDLINERCFDSKIKKILEECITGCYCILIKYHSFHNNTIRERIVEPHLLEIREGCYHLWAYCHERSEMRDFRVSRIITAQKTEIGFERRNKLLQNCTQNRFEKMSSQYSEIIKLEFCGFSARLIQEYYSNKADKLDINSDGTVLFERSTAITPDLIQWLLGFGPEVEVLEPDKLREVIRKTSFKTFCIYEK
jgi:predicted DNA-binding transcriptional regulator YafY